MLTPLNAILLKKWAGKSKLIELSIKTLCRSLVSTIKDEQTRKHILSFIQPITTFLLLGVFGSKEEEKIVFSQFQEKFRTLYQALYTFDPKEAIQEPSLFEQQVREKIKSSLST